MNAFTKSGPIDSGIAGVGLSLRSGAKGAYNNVVQSQMRMLDSDTKDG